MKKKEFEEKIDELTDDKSKTVKDKEEEDDGLPDFVDYLKSDEYIRDGSNSRMPMKIDFNGKDYQVFVRPLTSQEYYIIQLEAMNKKESLDLLACQIAMVDKQGRNVPAELIEGLKAGVIQDISAGIRLISGIDTDDMDYKEIMEYFLKN